MSISEEGTAGSAVLEEVQNRRDERGIPIIKVGVSDLRYPVLVMDRAQKWQSTVAIVRDVAVQLHSRIRVSPSFGSPW